MIEAGDRVRLEAIVVRARGDSATLQLPDGQAVHVGIEFLSPVVEDKALRPAGRKVSHGPNRVPD